MAEEFGIKELYDVDIRTNESILFNGRKYEKNESLLSFKQVELAQIREKKEEINIKGGQYNTSLLYWDVEQEMSFAISHGVLSPSGWSILSNSKMQQLKRISVPLREEKKVIEDEGTFFVELKECPNCIQKNGAQSNPEFLSSPIGRKGYLPLSPIIADKEKFIFCYDLETNEKILNFKIYENRIYFKKEHKKVAIDYSFDYEDSNKVLNFGKETIKSYLKLTGKMVSKDYYTGKTSAVILEIPKIKIRSSFQISLGTAYENSVISDFSFSGFPDDEGKTCKIVFLDINLNEEYM